MSNKKEAKELDKSFKIYTTLQLKIGKMDAFTPNKMTEVIICGMRAFKSFKGLTGVQKKENLIKMIKLLIKEHGAPVDWMDYNTDELYDMIDSLHEAGILKSCCIC